MNDDFAGQGGSYVLDPKTGKRRLVERTDGPKVQTQPQPAAPVAPAAESQPSSKE